MHMDGTMTTSVSSRLSLANHHACVPRANMTSQLIAYYDYIFFELMDQRVKGLLLMDSPIPMFLIVTSYLLFVLKLGPAWMKDRPPYNVERLMTLYNVVQMTINLHFVYLSIQVIWWPGYYTWVCQNPKLGPNPTEDYIVEKFHLFMFSRLLDLLDTVFMVLKKNNHQLTFLHIYHHVVVALSCWGIVKYLPGGHVVFFGTINSFVHVVMYFYYFLTAYDVSYKKSIWWKKHITQLQLVQFFVLLAQQVLGIISPSCEYPKFLLWMFVTQAMLMIYLFSTFYVKSYTTTPKKS